MRTDDYRSDSSTVQASYRLDPYWVDVTSRRGFVGHHRGTVKSQVGSKLRGRLQRLLGAAAKGHGFLALCMALALAGTVSAAYAVTAVVVPATLLAPRRWLRICVVTALGSALGATLLVIAFHDLGWQQIYERFPELSTHATWGQVIGWVSSYGAFALFVIAVSPLPQTPALIFFAIARHDYAVVFAAILAGKLLKYGVVAWVAARSPEQVRNGVGALIRRVASLTRTKKRLRLRNRTPGHGT